MSRPPRDQRFAGRTALVTGAAQGIGYAIAGRLLDEGGRVVLFDRNREALEAAHEELAARGQAIAFAGDTAIRADLAAAVAQAIERFGALDVLVAHAGIGDVRPFLEIDDATWGRMIDVNLTGVFYAVQEGARGIAASAGRGAIVVTASTNAFFPEQHTVHYSAAKGGVVALVRAVALDLADAGIRVNAVSPGIIRTPLAAPLTEDPEAARNVPARRPAEPFRRIRRDRGHRPLPGLRGVVVHHRAEHRGRRRHHARDVDRAAGDRGLMALDPGVEAALPKFFGTEGPPPADPIAAARERLESLAAHGPEVPGEVETRDLVIAGRLPVRTYAPGRPGGPALVFFHGGGWIAGSIASHDLVCRALAARLGAVVVSVDYRLAPEHLFPAAIEDAWLATQAVAADPGRFGAPDGALVVGGDSAGGAVATAVARRARDAGLELAGQMLVYPVVDAPRDRESYLRYAEGYGLTRASMQLFWRTYLGAASDDDPDAAPLRCGDLSGLAPAVVVTAECDVLRDEAEEYAERLREAGVEVGARRYAGLVHGFLRIAGEVPAARAAFDDLIALTSETCGYGE